MKRVVLILSLKPMERIKGLIFDLDGTIIDNDDDYMELMLHRVGRDLGYDFNLCHARELWYAIDSESRDNVIKRWGCDPDKFWTVFNRYENIDEKLRSTYLHEDAAILKGLDVPKGIVTHTSYDHTDMLLKMVGMRQYFNPIIACTEDTGYKPSPLPIIYCVVDMKLKPEEVAYVGDTLSDIMAAQNAGVRSIYINRFKRPIRTTPDYEIDSLEKLLDIVSN
ncbi:HAD family hydrolase [Methanocella paludicola]|nr:HAD family hydrolase [Methanocella paludicola]